MPKNSLNGDDRFCLFRMRLFSLKKRWVESWNLFSKVFSELNPLITFNPPKVSSIIDRKKPCSFAALSEFFFRDLPTLEIINPDIGIKIKTNNVSSKLMENITIIVNKIVRGSRTMSSKIDKNEC